MYEGLRRRATIPTLEKLGIDLTKDVFSHGQLYVALSRVRSWNSLSIRLLETNNERKVMNVVYKEILDENDWFLDLE